MNEKQPGGIPDPVRAGDLTRVGPSPQFVALQTMLSYAVDKARELPPGSVTRAEDALVGVYVTQIVGHVIEARR